MEERIWLENTNVYIYFNIEAFVQIIYWRFCFYNRFKSHFRRREERLERKDIDGINSDPQKLLVTVQNTISSMVTISR